MAQALTDIASHMAGVGCEIEKSRRSVGWTSSFGSYSMPLYLSEYRSPDRFLESANLTNFHRWKVKRKCALRHFKPICTAPQLTSGASAIDLPLWERP
jgi:hypothetical protein|tara:strand:- start:956 stop:1249 length:294 start_codon:yes stop_codon:yes gene_type:complete